MAGDNGDVLRFVLKNEAGFCVTAISLTDDTNYDSNKDKTNFCAGDQSRVKWQDLKNNEIYYFGYKGTWGAGDWEECGKVTLKVDSNGRITSYKVGGTSTYKELNAKNNAQMVSFIYELKGTTSEGRSCKFKEIERRKDD